MAFVYSRLMRLKLSKNTRHSEPFNVFSKLLSDLRCDEIFVSKVNIVALQRISILSDIAISVIKEWKSQQITFNPTSATQYR